MGYPAPDEERTLFGKLARKVEAGGHPPEEIVRRAAWIVQAWGPEALTLTALMRHWARAGSTLNMLTSGDVDRYRLERERALRRLRLTTASALERGTAR